MGVNDLRLVNRDTGQINNILIREDQCEEIIKSFWVDLIMKIRIMTNFYLALFNSLTWQEFLDANGKVYGTTKNKENRAKKLKPGDKLLCYISKIGTFSGVLEIRSYSYLDNTPVWINADYPIRFNVETLVSLEPCLGIPVKSLFNNLTIFTRLGSLKGWQGFFLNAFNQFPVEDGKLIEQKLMELKNV